MLCIILNNCAHNVKQKLSITYPVYNGKASVSQVSTYPKNVAPDVNRKLLSRECREDTIF